MALTSAVYAAGIDARSYSCADLQRMVAARGFIFINTPNFADFAVTSPSYCSGEGAGIVPLQRRSVPTIDNPECLVNYCGSTAGSSGGGGMGGGM